MKRHLHCRRAICDRARPERSLAASLLSDDPERLVSSGAVYVMAFIPPSYGRCRGAIRLPTAMVALSNILLVLSWRAASGRLRGGDGRVCAPLTTAHILHGRLAHYLFRCHACRAAILLVTPCSSGVMAFCRWKRIGPGAPPHRVDRDDAAGALTFVKKLNGARHAILCGGRRGFILLHTAPIFSRHCRRRLSEARSQLDAPPPACGVQRWPHGAVYDLS